MKITKKIHKQFKALTTWELRDIVKDITKENKKLRKHLYHYTIKTEKEIKFNQELFNMIMGIISFRSETKRKPKTNKRLKK